ncbi:hypothetical protein XV03_13670, partial [Mycobacterium avium subsp. hominissuis]
PRWVRADVLSTGDLVISGTTIAGVAADRRAATLIAHLAWLVLLLGSGAGVLVGAWRGRGVSRAR